MEDQRNEKPKLQKREEDDNINNEFHEEQEDINQ